MAAAAASDAGGLACGTFSSPRLFVTCEVIYLLPRGMALLLRSWLLLMWRPFCRGVLGHCLALNVQGLR